MITNKKEKQKTETAFFSEDQKVSSPANAEKRRRKCAIKGGTTLKKAKCKEKADREKQGGEK